MLLVRSETGELITEMIDKCFDIESALTLRPIRTN